MWSSSSRLLFSSQLTPLTSSTRSTSADRDSNTYQQFRLVDEKIASGVKEVMSVLPDEGTEGARGSSIVVSAIADEPSRAQGLLGWSELWRWRFAVRRVPV